MKNIKDRLKHIALFAMCKFLLIIKLFLSLVCPSCVMFATHKNHSVIEPEQAVRNLRDQFDKNIRSGN